MKNEIEVLLADLRKKFNHEKILSESLFQEFGRTHEGYQYSMGRKHALHGMIIELQCILAKRAV